MQMRGAVVFVLVVAVMRPVVAEAEESRMQSRVDVQQEGASLATTVYSRRMAARKLNGRATAIDSSAVVADVAASGVGRAPLEYKMQALLTRSRDENSDEDFIRGPIRLLLRGEAGPSGNDDDDHHDHGH